MMQWALGQRLPRHQGEVHTVGLAEPVTIRRDRHGVPYIEARSEADGWFALGFCHAQDRAGQLEILVRAVRGTLAELIGDDGVPIDRLSRRIGFRRAGLEQLAVMRPSIRAQIAAYTRGVNAGLAEGPTPHELAMLAAEPTPWSSGDVQGYTALLCFALASNWDAELMRLKVLCDDGPEALAAIDTPYPAHLPPSAQPLLTTGGMDRLARELQRFTHLVGHGGGSNAWAVAPRKTKSGRPILANDPHLVSQAPPLNYLAQIRAPGLEVAGASWVGIPAFSPGHNGFAAWGATAAHADNTDWFLEQLDGDRLRDGDGWVRCRVREETIRVRGRASIIERVLEGPRGPIIAHDAPGGDGAVHEAPRHARANALSLSASWLMRRPYTGLYRAHEARSFAAFRGLFEQGSTSTVSAVYADADGHIGWHIAVEVPERKAGYGHLPMPGWQRGVGWGDIIPFADMPHSVDPPEGFVCTANNAPTVDGEGPFLGVDWLDGYRQRRIADQLGARDDWDVEATAALQRDTLSLAWLEMRDAVLRAAAGSDDVDVQSAHGLLSAWDGRLDSSSVAASVYARFTTTLIDRLIRLKAPRAADWALGKVFTSLLPHNTIGTRRIGHLSRLVREQPQGFVADWGAAIREALAAAVSTLRSDHGPDPSRWRWGEVRPLVLVHAVSEQKPLDRVFDIGPFPGEGDNTTVSQGGIDFSAPPRRQAWLPALRAIIDVGDWDACRFAMLGGQSGNPLSPHYEDQAPSWQHGDGLALVWTEARIAAVTASTLRLLPR